MNLNSPLSAAVQRADALGWSVIPLRGGDDATTGKKPAIPWQSYQYRLPSPEELSRWFGEGQHSAYGVVCGEVSGLVVLDCDDAKTEQAFRETFPHLTETYAVQSGIRGTTHFYFRAPYTVNSRKLQGADLKAEGGYVVGAGSQIGDHVWTDLNDQRPRSLARTELDAIIAFLERPVAPKTIEALPSPRPASVIDAVAHYQRLVDQTGQRNDSLFQTACALRDRRIPQFEAAAQLVDLHTQQLPRLGQRQEREQLRRREAERTIVSAYSRPARRPRPSDLQTNQLPNTLREMLLKQSGGAAFLRTYEGLLLHGCMGGQIVARQAIFKKLAGLVGEHSIKRALAQTAPDGRPLLPRVMSPTAVSGAAADHDLFNGEEKTCLVDQKKPPKSKNAAHRPKKYYRLPTIEELCEVFGCAIQGVSDSITQDDLESTKAYRQALERELIRRKPGQYPQGWLADRLGVTERTIYRYHRDIPIHSAPTFIRMQLSLGTYQNWLPAKEIARRAGVDLRGQCLEDERGYRYPPVTALACELLQKGHQVWLLRRTYNYYWFGQEPAPAALTPTPRLKQLPIVAQFLPVQNRWIERLTAVAAPPMSKPTGRTRIIYTTQPPREERRVKQNWFSNESLLTTDPHIVERLAQCIYEALRTTQRPMMLRHARDLVEKYGPVQTERVFEHTKSLMAKGKLKNPAGFLMIALRSR